MPLTNWPLEADTSYIKNFPLNINQSKQFTLSINEIPGFKNHFKFLPLLADLLLPTFPLPSFKVFPDFIKAINLLLFLTQLTRLVCVFSSAVSASNSPGKYAFRVLGVSSGFGIKIGGVGGGKWVVGGRREGGGI